MFYGTVFILLLLTLFAHTTKRDSDKMTFFYMGVLFLVLLNGLRDPFLYPDNISYYEEFVSECKAPDESFNIGYIWFNKIILLVWKNYYFFSFICATLITLSYCRFIKEYTPYLFLSLTLFVLINFFPTFFIIRQYLAMPFILLSVKYIIKQEFIKFLVCILLAFSMHTTAAVFFPMFFLYKLKFRKRNMILVFVLTVVTASSLMTVGQYLAKFFPIYSHYVENEIEEAAWQRAVMKVFICLVYFISLGKNSYNQGINRIVFYSMILNVIICIGAMNMFGVFRLRDYFSIADILGVPLIIYYNKSNRKFKRFIVGSMTCIYIVLLFITFVRFVNSDNLCNGYQFFWNGYPH